MSPPKKTFLRKMSQIKNIIGEEDLFDYEKKAETDQ
jgi:hypothetical protein